MILSRIIIISLLVTSLAGPYNPVIATETDETPSITVLSDETASMQIFQSGTGQKIFDYLSGTTPARIERIRGLRSDIGDEILVSSAGVDHVVVVSDGNNNFGGDLEESIDFVSSTGTRVYAVTQTPQENDLSVVITGARTAVAGNENFFGVEVRQAQDEAEYTLQIEVDGAPSLEQTVTQNTPVKTIGFSNVFYALGPHVVTARILADNDMRPGNNVFNKTVYVVPKPEILLISSDTGSPLFKIIRTLYDVETAADPTGINLSQYRAVVLDNLNEGRLNSINAIREYTANGGGLMVVGGDNSYDKGDYLRSDLETVLPVESYPSSYAGSVNVVIVIDISGSITAYEALDDEKAMAVNLLLAAGRDTNVGVVAFGGEAIELSEGVVPMSVHANREALIDRVKKLKTGLGGTSIDEGIKAGAKMLDNTSGQKYMLVFSDGAIKDNFEDSKKEIAKIDTTKTKMIFAMIMTDVVLDRDVRADNNRGEYFLKLLAQQAGGDFHMLELDQRLNLRFGRESADTLPGEAEGYPVVRLVEDHFITRYLNVSGSILGFNDVTQKVGARRLVTTSMGKPVVTAWQFGMGRVVSLSTDNGNAWAGALYSGENARLIPSMMNWVIGDPRPTAGLVVYSSDIELGSPGVITIRSDETPGIAFKGTDIPVNRVDDRTYEGVLESEIAGVFPLKVSAGGVTLEDTAAVNYPLEYRDVGNNPDFLEAVKRNNGGVYNAEQAMSLLMGEIRENSVRTTVEHRSLMWVFLLSALLVFLAEVTVRRAGDIIDIKMRRRGEKD